ncbi:MAG TPA: 1,4-alpha-glucan branching protein GlgB [Rhodopila sp.]|uniref:1,4-alpha-glucan branching protein GlgB n=1 Tax=Rhodopila sp. TaxID=2480087 RepID=UPI002D0C0FFA|nr:1,4-alpha-glucan branching protein GlgB [Rhodopila sp.]HVY14658.1 1,4-alpha-glucan branching protein GlgB [Rhodopila sp.]
MRLNDDIRPDQAWQLEHGCLGDPFAVLGPFEVGGRRVVRTFQPGAAAVSVHARADGRELGTLEALAPHGLFAGTVASDEPYRLRVAWPGAVQETEDPYSFGPLLSDDDLYLFNEGRLFDLAATLGASVMTIDGVAGTRFAVWAPNAGAVSVVGDFNTWDPRRHPMRLRYPAGVWELFVPRIGAGTVYKFALVDRDGNRLPDKADPLARQTEHPPASASVVAEPDTFAWRDDVWMATRTDRQRPDAAIAIYEVHVASWFRNEDFESLDWDGLADRLVSYVRQMGFTHVELMPVAEYPFGGSWGYQPLSLFAPSARFGTPDGFRRFVEACHMAGIGVIIDWVPAHFPTDAYGLARFDGSALYEHADPREGFHHDWNTLIYNFGRKEVQGFLIASGLHWLKHFHVDGLRVDAVASMLYRDYSRKSGEWIPNMYGGRENLEAVEFLRHFNAVVHERVPGAITVAEESTAWPGVSRSIAEGGLGFSFKWNMGWMHDTLSYMEHDPVYRRYHHNEMTFGLIYAFSENFVLPLSHDEVVHGKGSLIGKMPGDDWQRFANLRAYFGFMWGHPGKKLLFMGGELAQWHEWNHDGVVDWNLLDYPSHRGIQTLVADLNALYRDRPALYLQDCAPGGFRWIVGDDTANSVFAFVRFGYSRRDLVVVVCNMTPEPRYRYRIGVPRGGYWVEVLNTDAERYGGSNLGNFGGVHARPEQAHGEAQSLELTLPPLSALFFAPEGVSTVLSDA